MFYEPLIYVPSWALPYDRKHSKFSENTPSADVFKIVLLFTGKTDAQVRISTKTHVYARVIGMFYGHSI